MSGPTATQSGVTSHVFGGTQPSDSDEWLPTGGTDPLGGESPGGGSGASGTGSPRIILESAAGHRIVLTNDDLVLAALLVGFTLEAVRWFR